MSLYKDEITVARSLAKVASDIIMYHYKGKDYLESSQKKWGSGNQHEPVTLADKDAHVFITKELNRIFPDDGVVSEEGIESLQILNKNMNHRRYWCVDPLDGTQEFLKEMVFEFCVMIALVDGERPVLGVIRNPAKDEEYYSVVGEGGYVVRESKARRLTVSIVDQFKDARLMASRSHFSYDLIKIARKAGMSDDKIVRTGSVGVKVGILSESGADLYLHPKTGCKIWDVAAPEAILTESGGLMSDCLGRPIKYRRDIIKIQDLFLQDGFVASNGMLHDKTIQLVRKMLNEGEISIQS